MNRLHHALKIMHSKVKRGGIVPKEKESLQHTAKKTIEGWALEWSNLRTAFSPYKMHDKCVFFKTTMQKFLIGILN